MLMCLALVFFLVPTCEMSQVKPSWANDNDDVGAQTRQKIYGHKTAGRQKRNIITLSKAILVGIKATNDLLKGTRKTASQKYINKYEKSGTYEQAVDDFFSVNPRSVVSFKLPNSVEGKIGLIGDRTILVRSSSKDGSPILKILKPFNRPGKYDDSFIHQILYKQK